jgi:hypothetical protein
MPRGMVKWQVGGSRIILDARPDHQRVWADFHKTASATVPSRSARHRLGRTARLPACGLAADAVRMTVTRTALGGVYRHIPMPPGPVVPLMPIPGRWDMSMSMSVLIMASRWLVMWLRIAAF